MERLGPSRREVVSGVLALCTVAGVPPAVAAGDELRFGLTPVFLTSDLELLDRLRSYLEHATGSPVRLVTRRTYQEITSLLLSGQLDAAWICGFPFVANQPRLALVAVPVWQGKPLYRSYLITGRDREAASLDDLRGDVHAFSDPDSNSGWLVTATALAGKGQTPERFFGRTIFTYGHRNVIRAVASGLAMSGSVDEYVYEVIYNDNDNGSTQAMAYPTERAKPKQTFMLFAYPMGVQGNVVSAGVNEFIIPNYKQTWGNIRKIADAPEAVRGLSFKSKEYSTS